MHLRKSTITIVVIYTIILLLAFELFNVKDSEFLKIGIKSEENTVDTITTDNPIEQIYTSKYNFELPYFFLSTFHKVAYYVTQRNTKAA